MTNFDHPWELVTIGVLSVLSMIWCWQGFRRRDIPLTVWGIAAGLPPFDIESWRLWFVAGVLWLVGWSLKRKFEGI